MRSTQSYFTLAIVLILVPASSVLGQVDALEMATVVLTKFASTPQKRAQHKPVAEEALKLVDQAVTQDKFTIADQLAQLALAEARKSHDKYLLFHAQERASEVADLSK